MKGWRLAAAGAAALLLAGCAVPVRRADTRVAAAGYVPGGIPAHLGGRPVRRRDEALAWWREFHNPALEGLVAEGLADNPGLAAARARIARAKAQAAAANGAFLPHLEVTPGATRQAFPAGPYGFPPYTVYELTGTISYNPGLFGARHYAFRNGRALAAYQRAEADAARLTLAQNIVDAAITLAGLEARIANTQALAAGEARLLRLVRGEFAAGAIPMLPVLQQKSEYLATAAQLPPLEGQASAARHSLAVLAGVLPADFAAPPFRLGDFSLPAEISLSVPSRFLENRPDIRAARALVAARHAALGQAAAALYPQLSLSAQGGYASEAINTLFEPGAALWTLAGNLLTPLLDGGELRASRQAARAGLAVALDDYRNTVLTAFQQVADALRHVEEDRAATEQAREAAAAARATFRLARRQFALGGIDYNSVLTAEITWRQARLALIQARTRRLLDNAALSAAMARAD
ncbi:MAG TPA: efflux transporter outer membrane subunit [Acetobacteraceae bacterium]|nr:efflux transporter outer membrane subunit [Acetobacteraceae bacterium]